MSSIRLSKSAKIASKEDMILLLNKLTDLKVGGLTSSEIRHAKAQLENDTARAVVEQEGRLVMIAMVKGKQLNSAMESARVAGDAFVNRLDLLKRKKVQVVSKVNSAISLALIEGVLLGSYRFAGYKSKKGRSGGLTQVQLVDDDVSASQLRELKNLCRSVFWARDLVNRPLSHLSATDLATEIQRMGKDAGFEVDVFRKKKIETLKMGGLLAVNRGSLDPPTFSVLEWKPSKAKNKKPVLLVGKGVVYDTGGLSLKPTPNSMDMMKCDMAGAACMSGVMHAIAKNKLPLHVIALVPATDNRPGVNAYVPGDVITMHDGQTVEVLNTDAEGRLIMADAHSYGKRYDPELVIDAATLTGAAARAIGEHGVVAMGTASEKHFKLLSDAGDMVYERIALMPFWDEYDKDLDSDIADMKNLGGAAAGHITAGKFLARFVEAPFVHLDIAGPAFITAKSAYRPKGGTGVGVRLLYGFLKSYAGK